MRTLNIYNTRIVTKNKSYLLNDDEYCEFCAEKNTIFHSIIYCEKYKSYKRTFVPEIKNSEMEKGFFYFIINSLDEEKIKKLVKLVHIILNDLDKLKILIRKKKEEINKIKV